MFGDLSGMMNKLKEAQQKVEETKTRLNSVLVDETSADKKIKITLTANREIKAIAIDESLLADKEEISPTFSPTVYFAPKALYLFTL